MRLNKFLKRLDELEDQGYGEFLVVQTKFDNDLIIEYASNICASIDNGVGLWMWIEYTSDKSKALTLKQFTAKVDEVLAGLSDAVKFPYTPVMKNKEREQIKDIVALVTPKRKGETATGFIQIGGL